VRNFMRHHIGQGSKYGDGDHAPPHWLETCQKNGCGVKKTVVVLKIRGYGVQEQGL
jgi:hypothetical protein